MKVHRSAETEEEETQQTSKDFTFDSIIGFITEIAVRLFLFNVVKLLLIIALITADASICVFVYFYFGIVVGLSVMMVVNIGLAAFIGYFTFVYSRRPAGRMHIAYGQHAIKQVSNATSALTSGNLAGAVSHVADLAHEQPAAVTDAVNNVTAVLDRRASYTRSDTLRRTATDGVGGGGGGARDGRQLHRLVSSRGGG